MRHHHQESNSHPPDKFKHKGKGWVAHSEPVDHCMEAHLASGQATNGRNF